MINRETRDGSAYDDVFVGDIDEQRLAAALNDYVNVAPETHQVFPRCKFYELTTYKKVLVDLLARAAASKMEYDDWLHVEPRHVADLRTEYGVPMGMLERFERKHWIEISERGVLVNLAKVDELVDRLQHQKLRDVLVEENDG